MCGLTLPKERGTKSAVTTASSSSKAASDLLMSNQAFNWMRHVAILLSVAWAGIFGYLEAVALNYSILAEVVFSHFTIENVLLAGIAVIFGLLPFAVAIRFGDARLCRKSIISVIQITCISILFEDIAYFISLGELIRPGDWTTQILGGFFVPYTILFIPTWYIIALLTIVATQITISRI